MGCSMPASLSFTVSQSLLKLISIASVMPPNHLLVCRPLLLPSIFPSIRVFCNEWALHIRWPKYSVLCFSTSPSNEYSGLISLGQTGLISLLSKGLSRGFSSTTIWKCQVFGAQPSSWSNSQIVTYNLTMNLLRPPLHTCTYTHSLTHTLYFTSKYSSPCLNISNCIYQESFFPELVVSEYKEEVFLSYWVWLKLF